MYVIGNVLDVLPTLEADRFQCVVTSPPYWGMRDYGHPDQLGLEPLPGQYVANVVAVMRQVRRVLRPDGTLWLNIGDCFAGSGRGGYVGNKSNLIGSNDGQEVSKRAREAQARARAASGRRSAQLPPGIKPKDLMGMPWQVAFALRDDGWYLRMDIVWNKPNPTPESTRDRPTRAHEYLFLLSKRPRYYYDRDAIAELATWGGQGRRHRMPVESAMPGAPPHRGLRHDGVPRKTRNARSVWTIAPQPFRGAHFATMPPKLAERCMLAGSRPDDEVLDPFLGSGTVGMVAQRLTRRWFGVEINPSYAPLIEQRTRPPEEKTMASKFATRTGTDAQGNYTYADDGAAPLKRQHVIDGCEVNLLIDGEGVEIQKKGDKHRVKPTIKVSWLDILEIGADRQKARGELGDAQSAYDFLGLDS